MGNAVVKLSTFLNCKLGGGQDGSVSEKLKYQGLETVNHFYHPHIGSGRVKSSTDYIQQGHLLLFT